MSGMDQYEAEGLDQEFTEQMTYEERVRVSLHCAAAASHIHGNGSLFKGWSCNNQLVILASGSISPTHAPGSPSPVPCHAL